VDYEGGRVTYIIEWAGLTFGGDGPYQLVELSGLHDAPAVRTSDSDRARGNGQWAGTDYLTGRSILATFEVVGKAAPSAETALAAFSAATVVGQGPESPLTVQVPGVAGGRRVTVGARVRRVSLPVDRAYMHEHGVASVEWWATDPRFYDETVGTVTTGIGTLSGVGLTFDATPDLYFGGPVPSGVVNVTNDGEVPAPWRVTFTGPVTDPRIENVTTGTELRLIGTVPAGADLVIDSAARSVALNGVSRYGWLKVGSSWSDLAPGPNTVRLTAAAGTGTATLTFRSTWI
jgi:hypothetical protein